MNIKEKFLIQGLAGEKKLRGTVRINGAKNAALKAMAAAILFDGPVRLENVPDTSDIDTLTGILKGLGAKVEAVEDTASHSALMIDASGIDSTAINEELAKGMRASVVLTGPMLGRYKKVLFPAPGGCVIGARPIDLFLNGYEKMGAKVNEHDCVYDISAPQGLSGTEISFNKISVGATETLMMAAVLAKGTTVLKNCALEPEIGNVAEWLNASGVKISGVGTPTITIEGTDGKLLSAKKSFVTIPDRITAGSFLILGALCAKELTIENCIPKHVESLIDLLKNSGVNISTTSTAISITNNNKPNSSFKAFNVETREYPGFPTDLQAPLVTYLTQVSGKSDILEKIFEGRFKYVNDLGKMGADITSMNPHEISINGPTQLKQLSNGQELQAHDIRAGFAIVLAALVGKGQFTVNNVHLIDRGYEHLEVILKNLGADVERNSE